MSKIAVIDMGTNTFHLLIADVERGTCHVVHRSHEAVKIGMGGINEGLMSDAACARALATMIRFSKTIAEQNVSRVYAFGTSALRHAQNASHLVDKINSATGITIRVVSGEEEADLIFEGVSAALDLEDQVSLVMDIGAGSVEFIIGDNHTRYWKKSFEIGGQRLLEKFQKNDPITAHEIKALDSFFDEALAPLQQALKEFNPTVLVGASGTFDTLSDIFSIRRGITRRPEETETPLTPAGFYEIYHELISKNRTERMQIPGMIDMRVDMIVVTCCLIRFILENHEFKRIRVSTYSLKEGVLARLSRQG